MGPQKCVDVHIHIVFFHKPVIGITSFQQQVKIEKKHQLENLHMNINDNH